jgi:hypothetical protein
VQIVAANAAGLLARLRQMPGVREATIFGQFIHALVETEQIDALKSELPDAQIEPIVPSLEDVFVTLTYKIQETAQ